MTEKGRAELRKTFQTADDRVGYTDIQSAYLTQGNNTGKLLVDNLASRRIWVHRRREDDMVRDQIPCWYPHDMMLVPLRDGDLTLQTVKVRIGKPPNIDEWFVIDGNELDGLTAMPITPMENFINQGNWAGVKQFTLFRPRPTGVASKSIFIDIDDSLSLLQPSTNELHLVSNYSMPLQDYIDALGAGEHQLLLPYYDRELLLWFVLAQDAVSSAASVGTSLSHGEFTADDMPNFAGILPHMVLTTPLEVYYGQTSITEAAFYRDLDARPFFSGGGGSASQVYPDVIRYTVTIGADYQGNFRKKVTIEDGGKLILDGRLYIE